MPTLALFIDGLNLLAAARALGFDIDYKRLLTYFQSCGNLVRASFYTTVLEGHESHSARSLIDWLTYNGFTVVSKPAKEFDDVDGRRKFKRNMRVELAVDVMQFAGHVDQIIIISGNSDYCKLVEAAQRRGVHVTVVSTMKSRPPLVADELRRQADLFTELAELIPVIKLNRPGLSESPTLETAEP
jgi:uncharacterized LabA/DUF88 family protein